MTTPCPSPGKLAWHSYGAALAAASRLAGQHGVAHRAYRCPCNAWHVTTRDARKVGR